jgi:AAA lid domain
MQLPNFANARSIRNALDRARLRQANRLFERRDSALTRDDLIMIDEPDIRASRVFSGGVDDQGADLAGLTPATVRIKKTT